MWLEIEDDLIVGVHSEQCESKNQWVEHPGKAMPGDYWQKNQVIPQKEAVDQVAQNRIMARAKILEFYPEWKQLNILREGREPEITKMGRFIDACRDWSNKANGKPSQLNKITP